MCHTLMQLRHLPYISYDIHPQPAACINLLAQREARILEGAEALTLQLGIDIGQ